jgi:hypothetical protein
MTDSIQTRRTYRRLGPTSAGTLPKYLFLIAAGLGILLVWVVKAQNWPLAPTVAVPISIIAVYCLMASFSSWFYIREDQIGDNAYYLGFLFTLTSLAYALWNFQSAGLGRSPEDIIISFGVALWSTIVGIALRVFYSQLRQDPQDIEKEARARIAEAASRLSGELYQAQLTFNTYTRSLQQSMQEALIRASETATNGLNSSIEQFTNTTHGMVSKIEGAFSEFNDQSIKLNLAATKTVEALVALNQRIEKVEAPDTLIHKKIDGIFQGLDKSTAKLNELASRQTVSVEGLVNTTEAMLQNVRILNDTIANMKDNASTVGAGAQNMQRVTVLIQELQSSLMHLSDGFTALHNRQLQAVKGIEQHADEMGRQLERSRKYTEETHDSLVSMTKAIADKLQ